jgi:hypothetical protein
MAVLEESLAGPRACRDREVMAWDPPEPEAPAWEAPRSSELMRRREAFLKSGMMAAKQRATVPRNGSMAAVMATGMASSQNSTLLAYTRLPGEDVVSGVERSMGSTGAATHSGMRTRAATPTRIPRLIRAMMTAFFLNDICRWRSMKNGKTPKTQSQTREMTEWAMNSAVMMM